MFDFLLKRGGEKTQSMLELITIDAKKASIMDMAIEKANNMIAKAIAKSEFIVWRNGEKTVDNAYWTLNVKPNPNETATEFWMAAILKVLRENECLIVNLKGNLYRAYSFQEEEAVTKGNKYTSVVIETGNKTEKLVRNFKADEVIHLRNTNKKIIEYTKKNLALYNTIATGLINSKRISSIPKFTLDIEGQAPIIRSKDSDGKEKVLTIDEYKKKIKTMLEAEKIEVLTNQTGLKINSLQINNSASVEDIVKIAKEVFAECAYAYDIPAAVFLGTITEKADSTNEFITYAVNWLVEILNDSMTAALVGKDSYIKGEKIWIDMTKFKHVDIIESATNLEKLRGIGFNFDEILEFMGRQPLNTEFSKRRVVTKNFGDDVGGENNA